MDEPELILLTGATGYVGGQLLPLLARQGFRVRCLARKPQNLRVWLPPGVEVAQGDVLDAASLNRALAGVARAFYLIHSMGAAGDFAETDRRAAQLFGEAARTAGVKTVIYLGALADQASALSPHLRSRQEVGQILRASGVAVIELRASIIIGAGSLSFEMIRALVERLPVMVTPKWVNVPAQPIAIEDVLAYLLAALRYQTHVSRTFEIGGSDTVSYGELMREYARQRGLRRWMIRVPVLTPRLSSLWLGLVTPLYARIGRKLIDGVRHPTVVRDTAALAEFAVKPIGMREAIARALRNESVGVRGAAGAGSASHGDPADGGV
jgi:uncharacterized protein YbjT (DUF2867 family)